MIYTINLSQPRKKIQNFYDLVMFTIKYKHFKNNIRDDVYKNKVIKISAIVLLLAILSCSEISAKEISIEGSKVNIDQIIKSMGYPTFDAIYQMIKMGNLAYGHVD